MGNIYDGGRLVRHVAEFNDKRCTLVLQLPEEKDVVHIIDTDSIPDQHHDFLMKVLESDEAQTSVWLGDVLARRLMGDGANALNKFYQLGLISKVPVDRVVMLPRPNQRIPLKDVIQGMQDATTKAEFTPAESDTTITPEMEKLLAEEQEKVNQHRENHVAADLESKKAQAANLLIEANMLVADAIKKRESALALDPSLRSSVQESVIKETENQPVDIAVTENTESASKFVDAVTGKGYKSEAALKAAITRRENSKKSA